MGAVRVDVSGEVSTWSSGEVAGINTVGEDKQANGKEGRGTKSGEATAAVRVMSGLRNVVEGDELCPAEPDRCTLN